jgi:hypothetical protein
MRWPAVLFWCGCLLATLSCSSAKKEARPVPKANVLLVLDLSDRILEKDQPERDKALVNGAFNAFEMLVKQRQYIHSNDVLQVLILPQKNTPAGMYEFEKKMRLGMREVELKQKSTYLKNNKPGFMRLTDSLYRLATRKKSSSDFAGADTWQFFNQLLPHYLSTDSNTQNKIILITDGYLDFENLEHKKQQGCRYSYSGAIMQQARQKGERWKQVFENGCGLLPVNLNQPNTQLLVLELQRRNTFVHEKELLSHLWNSWMAQMNIGRSRLLWETAVEDEQKAIMKFIAEKPKQKE